MIERIDNKIQKILGEYSDPETKRKKLYEYLESLVVGKTYGTFRIFSRGMQIAMEKYLAEGILTKEDVEQLKITIDKKKKLKTVMIAEDRLKIDFEKFLGDAKLAIDLYKESINTNKLNILFLLPFFHLSTLNDVLSLKVEDIEFVTTGDQILMKVSSDNLNKFIVLEKYGPIYQEAFNLLKQIKESNNEKDLFFLKTNQVTHKYKMLNQQLESELKTWFSKEMDFKKATPISVIKEVFQKSEIGKIIRLL